MSEESTNTTTDPAVEKREKDIRRVRRMVGELYSLAEHASLTGAFHKDGALEAVRVYNDVLTVLQNLGVELHGMFSALPSDANFDRIGVASRLLRGYLEDDNEEYGSSKNKNKGVKIVIGKHNEHGEHTGHINLEELGKLKDIGTVIRAHLPEWLREAPPAPPAAPVPPAPPAED